MAERKIWFFVLIIGLGIIAYMFLIAPNMLIGFSFTFPYGVFIIVISLALIKSKETYLLWVLILFTIFSAIFHIYRSIEQNPYYSEPFLPLAVFIVQAIVLAGCIMGVGAGLITIDREVKYIFAFLSALPALILFLSIFTRLFMGLSLGLYGEDIFLDIVISCIFFIFFFEGFNTGQTIKSTERSIDIIMLILSILSLFLALLDGVFNISIKWPFFYFGIFYLGFFFWFQCIYGALSLLKNFLILHFIFLVAALFIIENYDILGIFKYPFETGKSFYSLFLIGFLLGLKYPIKQENSIEIT